MNRNVITYILGYVMQIEAILMLVPCVTAICYGETTVALFYALLISEYGGDASAYWNAAF